MSTFNLTITVENINKIEPLDNKAMYIDVDVKKFESDVILDELIKVIGKDEIIDYVESTK